MLDSAEMLLRGTEKNDPDYFEVRILYNHLADLPNANAYMVDQMGMESVLERLNHKSFDNKHAWTAYRIGESMRRLQRLDDAIILYRRAVELP